MTEIEDRLRAAMHSAVDGKEPSARELISLVKRRHRRHTIRVACIAVLAALAVAVPAAITLHDTLGASGPVSPVQRPRHPAKHLPTKMSGLPMPAGTNFQLLVSAGDGAAWYSTAARRAEHIGGLPRSQGGYQFGRVYGGWVAKSNQTPSYPCPTSGPIACAGPPQEFYFIADGSPAATRIGAGYAQDGVVASSRPGAVWLATYPRASVKITGSATAQLVSTTGRPLGPRYQLPAHYLLGSGVGNYLLLVNSNQQNLSILWDPRTGRVLRHFDNVIATGPEQIAWSPGCRSCRVQILNVSTGTTVTTPIPGNPAALGANFSDDGRLLAVGLPGRELEVFGTGSRTLTVVPGTALSSAEWENVGWQPGGHRLVIAAGPNSTVGPAQLAYWQPGDAALRVATVRNLREITELQTGGFG
jgi:hypothetical protein